MPCVIVEGMNTALDRITEGTAARLHEILGDRVTDEELADLADVLSVAPGGVAGRAGVVEAMLGDRVSDVELADLVDAT